MLLLFVIGLLAAAGSGRMVSSLVETDEPMPPPADTRKPGSWFDNG